ncbi:uncharacterized protein LOC111694522 [Trichogramma pretiosum]|uniref:uncharacterized protein LOC111694522 n=1 Tax=Trichogramma pretiosum TaxID=7493 RepID=UPI000C71C47D|nr:uncharacterized protein LOC111694522 [Trichogramma pretiosum]
MHERFTREETRLKISDRSFRLLAKSKGDLFPPTYCRSARVQLATRHPNRRCSPRPSGNGHARRVHRKFRNYVEKKERAKELDRKRYKEMLRIKREKKLEEEQKAAVAAVATFEMAVASTSRVED